MLQDIASLVFNLMENLEDLVKYMKIYDTRVDVHYLSYFIEKELLKLRLLCIQILVLDLFAIFLIQMPTPLDSNVILTKKSESESACVNLWD